MSYRIRGEDKFPLLEAAIGLVMMVVVGILILQLFMVGARINTRAVDINTAQMLAMNTLEEMRSSVGLIFAPELTVGSQVSSGQSPFVVIDEGMNFVFLLETNESRLIKYYDADWNRVYLEEAQDESHTPQNGNAVFKFELRIMALDGELEYDIVGLMETSIYIWDLRQMDIGNPIVYFYTKLYFPIVGELT